MQVGSNNGTLKEGGRGSWTREELATLHRVYRIATWPGIFNALPGRSRHAIAHQAFKAGIIRKVNRKRAWLGTEIVLLRKKYATSTWQELRELFPRHGRNATQEQAKKLGLRKSKVYREPKLAFLRVLQRERIRLNLTQAQLASRIGCYLEQLSSWERGLWVPKVKQIQHWADALDMELAVKPKAGKRKTDGNDHVSRAGLHEANGAGMQAQGLLDRPESPAAHNAS